MSFAKGPSPSAPRRASHLGRTGVLLLLSLLLASPPLAAQEGWSDEVLSRIDALVQQQPPVEGEPRPLAVFDFDNTMIWGDISFAMMNALADSLALGFDPAGPDSPFRPVARRLFASLAEARTPDELAAIRSGLRYEVFDHIFAIWSSGRKSEACAELTRLLSGLRVGEVKRLALAAFEAESRMPVCDRRLPAPDERADHMVHQGLRPRPAIRWMLEHLGKRGVEVWVVSASPERVVEAVAGHAYGIAPERVLGVRAREVDGTLTRDILPPVTYGAGKVEAIRSRIGRRPLLVFGDAWTDFEMLSSAELGVLIDRGKEDLKRALKGVGTVVVQPPFPGEARAGPCPSAAKESL